MMEGEGKPCRHRHRHKHKHKHRREKARCVHGPSCAGEPHDSVGVEGNNGMVESVALSTSSMRPVLRPALKLSELRAYGLALHRNTATISFMRHTYAGLVSVWFKHH